MTNYPNNLDDIISIPIATTGSGSGSAPDATSTVKGILKLRNDLGGSANSPSVVGLQGYSINDTAPAADQVLTWSNVDAYWYPKDPSGTVVSDADGSTKGIIKLTNDLGGTADLPKVIGLQGNPVASDTPADNNVLAWSDFASTWAPVDVTVLIPDASTTTRGLFQLTNDFGGSSLFPRVVGIQGRSVASEGPVTGYGLIYNSNTLEYTPEFIDGYSYATIASGIESLIGIDSNVFTSIGTIQLNTGNFGSNPVFSFEAIFQATSGQTAEVRLYNLTDGAVISGSTLSTTSTSFEFNSALITLDADTDKLYEAQFRITNGSPSSSDGVICGNVRIGIRLRDF